MDTNPLDPNNTSNNAPTGTPTPTPTPAPTASPTDTPTNAPDATPNAPTTNVPAEAATNVSTEAPANTPDETAVETPTGAPTDITPSTDNPSKAHKKPIVLIGVIAALSVALIVVIVVLIINLSPNNGGTNKKSPETTQNDNYEDDYSTDDDYNDIDNGSGTANSGGNANLTSNWQNYNFSVNGQTLTLPLPYQNLSAASGFTMKDADAGSTIASNYYTLANMFQNGKLALYTEVTNNSNDYLKLSDCEVTRVSQTLYMVKNGAATVTFPGNLYAGMTMDESTLTSILGTPSDSKDYSGTKEIRYFANPSWTTANYYQITIKDGVIDDLVLDNR